MNKSLGKNGLVVLFVCTAFLSAALLFLSEPMIAKLLLPLFGGSPAVWNTCMVFFQTTLLLGYAYAHYSIKGMGLKFQPWLHSGLMLMPLVVLPLVLPVWAKSSAYELPITQIIAILIVTIGAPFFILGTSGPLLQRWFAATNHPKAHRPYFLYAASNFGSFVALFSYPLVVEPNLSLESQSRIWSTGYVIFVILMLVCMILLFRYRQPLLKRNKTEKKAIALSWKLRLTWLILSFLPSSLMLGVTTHVSRDVAAVPLLWVIPLALYLLTFVLVFSTSKPLRLVEKVAPFAAAGLFIESAVLTMPIYLPRIFVASIHFAIFGLIAFIAHGRLADGRPEPARLTEFYLWVAAGGMLGGIFNSLIAPIVFNSVYEFPLALLLAVPATLVVKNLMKQENYSPKSLLLILAPGALYIGVSAVFLIPSNDSKSIIILCAEIIASIAVFRLYLYRPWSYAAGMLPLLILPLVLLARQQNLFMTRTFYGIIKVSEIGNMRVLVHGGTQHGSQHSDASMASEPTTYYNRKGPLGDALGACRELSECRQVGVLGLGVGTLAAYGRAGDNITFYEIDPEIIKIAYDSRFFSYLKDSKAGINIVTGDGRLSLERTINTYDILIIDAFSADAIPTHLLTREAIQLYQTKLNEHGLLIIHISNRYLKLEPILKALADDQALEAIHRYDSGQGSNSAHLPSQWVVLAKNQDDLVGFDQYSGWQPLQGRDVRVWTDNYSNILDALF